MGFGKGPALFRRKQIAVIDHRHFAGGKEGQNRLRRRLAFVKLDPRPGVDDQL